MDTKNSHNLRRVVVALDAAADFGPAIEIAASVAAGLELALHAVLFEDENLLRLAALPFAQHVDLGTAERGTLDLSALRREFERCAGQVRRLLESAAGQHALPVSFEVKQAAIGLALSGMEEDELLTLGMASREVAGLARMQSPWHDVVGRLRQPLLLIGERPSAGGPVAVVHDATAAGERAVRISLRIARAGRRSVSVLVPSVIGAKRRAGIQSGLRAEAAEAVMRNIESVSLRALQGYVQASGAGLVVLCRSQISDAEDGDALLVSPPGSLLVL